MLSAGRGRSTDRPLTEILWSSNVLVGHPGRDDLEEPCALNRLDAAQRRAVRGDGRLVPPLGLFEGRLELLFDDAATLRTVVALMQPDGARDEALQAVLNIAQEVLSEPPVPATLAGDIATDLLNRFGQQERLVPIADFRDLVDGMLLQRRLFRRVRLLGGHHVHGRLIPYGATQHDRELQPVPVYIPEDGAAQLPAVRRLDVRLLATLHGRLEQSARFPYALRALSVTRTIHTSTIMGFA